MYSSAHSSSYFKAEENIVQKNSKTIGVKVSRHLFLCCALGFTLGRIMPASLDGRITFDVLVPLNILGANMQRTMQGA